MVAGAVGAAAGLPRDLARVRERDRPFAEGDGDALVEAVREKAREKAGSAWYGDQFTWGECHDPYLALVHESGDPLTGGFEDLAERLLVPLARAQP